MKFPSMSTCFPAMYYSMTEQKHKNKRYDPWNTIPHCHGSSAGASVMYVVQAEARNF
jgi:hypothetical protein